MSRSKGRRVGVIDNDVLVNIFDYLYRVEPFSFNEALDFLKAKYHELWIPDRVQDEFTLNGMSDSRKRRLAKILATHSFVKRCPVDVGRNEIEKLNPGSARHLGERDAVLQCEKAAGIAKLRVSRIEFFTNDAGAVRLARTRSIPVFEYREFYGLMAERVIGLPRP
jgi:hypothetical protein